MALCLVVGLSYAWTTPTSALSPGNVSAPLDIGPDGQTKEGELIINTGGATDGLIIGKGNVGIGTTNPAARLEVNGNIELSGASQTYKITNLAVPPADSGAVTKAYVDAAVSSDGCYTVLGVRFCAADVSHLMDMFLSIAVVLIIVACIFLSIFCAGRSSTLCSVLFWVCLALVVGFFGAGLGLMMVMLVTDL